jgi:15-cis-phytoene synthase
VTTLALVPVAPAQIARGVISRHSKSFSLASRLLPARARDEAIVLYAWCRRVDDAVDERAGTDEPGADVIARLAAEIEEAYAGGARDPVLMGFGAVARARGIPRTYPDALVAGMEMDVHGASYATVDDLVTYAWRVAGVVGLMMTHVLGVSDDDALVPAAHLGIAMQVTNVCRDVAEDWTRGRLYVPDELLARHGAGGLAGELGKALPASAVVPLANALRELLALADRYYRSSDGGLSRLPWRAALGVRLARDIYSAIGTQIARAGHDVTAGRAMVSRTGKLARVASAVARALAAAPVRAARVAGSRGHGPPTRTQELADVPRL